MPNSYAQSAQLTCPVCGQPFAADIWLIVDVDERPDLAARARAGDLHAVACPRCGPQGAVDAPLLLYLPHADPATGQPPLIFSPAQQTSAEQDQEMANGLLGTLAQRLGAAWQDEWLAQVATVQRQLLPVALSDDPAAAMREMREEIEGEEIEEEEIEGKLPPAVAAALEAVLRQLAEEGATVESPEDLERALAARPDLRAKLEAGVREISPDDNPGIFEDSGIVAGENRAPALPALLDRFVRLNTWDDAQRMVEEHPALLSDEADQMFAAAIVQARQDAGAVEHFTRLQALLRRCRAAGIARAFAEQMLPPEMLAEAERLGLTPEEFLAQMRAAQQQMPPALREVLAELAAAGVEIHSPEDLERALAARPDLRAKLEAVRREISPDDNPGIFEDSGIVPGEDLPALINRFLAADTWDESQRIVAAHPALLSDAADERFALALAEYADDPDAVAMLNTHRALLRRCREAGVARAFAEQMLPPEMLAEAERLGLTPEEFLAQLRAAQQTNGPAVPPEFAADLRAAQEGEQRYRRSGDLAALDAAAAAWARILDAPGFSSTNDRFRLAALNNASGVFLRRYWARGRSGDLDRAVAGWEQAVKLTPPDSPDRIARLNNLGAGLSSRYARTGRLEDLEAAIGFYEQAVQLAPPGSPDLPRSLNNLGNGLRDRYARTGRLEDLEAAIEFYEQAVKLTPPDSPDRPGSINNLGNGLSDRYTHTGRLEDLVAAIGFYEQAVQLTPPDSPDRPARLNNLGAGLRFRYERTGQMEDLEASIGVYKQAVQLTPPDSPDIPGSLNNLGNGLRDRYARTGRLKDLEAAIGFYEQAVKLTPPDSSDLPGSLNNLGAGLRSRYERTGRLEDLEAAIGFYEQAVHLTLPDSPDRPARLSNLGAGLISRYWRIGRPQDLEAAIGFYEQAVKLTPPDSPDRPSRLNNLGNGLIDRYAHTAWQKDLEAAIEVYEQAVKLTPPNSPVRPARLNNLGNALRDRYARTGRQEDLEAAIGFYEQAVKLTLPDSPDRPARLNNLGNGLRDRHARTGRLKEMEEAICDFRSACELGAVAAPEDALRAARNWGRWAMQRQAWAEVDEACTHGLATGRALHRRQVRRADKESWLRDVQEMAPAAAYAQARLGDLPRAAVTLEAGRAQLLAEGLEQNRRDLERLPSLGHGDLHARYLAALATRRRLEQSDAVVADRLAAIAAADREFDAVVAAIRSVDGYADFFAEPTFARLQAAAQDGPLVYLAATAAGGLALIVHGQEHKPGFWEKPGLSADAVTAVWLDDLTDARVREWLVGPEAAAGNLGGWLGAYQGWLQALQQAQQFSRLPRDDARRQAAEAAAATAQTQWFATLDAVTAALWPAVLAPLSAALTHLTIPQSPNLSISNLPLPSPSSPPASSPSFPSMPPGAPTRPRPPAAAISWTIMWCATHRPPLRWATPRRPQPPPAPSGCWPSTSRRCRVRAGCPTPRGRWRPSPATSPLPRCWPMPRRLAPRCWRSWRTRRSCTSPATGPTTGAIPWPAGCSWPAASCSPWPTCWSCASAVRGWPPSPRARRASPAASCPTRR
jgi:tetratricopeptide (TPR) repeat protein